MGCRDAEIHPADKDRSAGWTFVYEKRLCGHGIRFLQNTNRPQEMNGHKSEPFISCGLMFFVYALRSSGFGRSIRAAVPFAAILL
jgi:hypothetical protein